ncbi:ABC transporter permease [Pseudomonas syringae pv. tagetis]|nr:ABC transporter permease [Pseudomonas syringae group genomosp. 7]KPY89200.1 ABC-type proline/glycine betaine transport system, permease component [Pseudomonas syringae pv. tagetis]RMR06684.1 ABC-type proline/glycine betaine transport system [Pseudomonas syringae pv. helianthi]RMW16486.1 ABC-type proline/glycine betaine transport system [Pseudomonas syringae pv. tagetis]UNB65472.1 ABC transporter permease [Pseudomonas syringae pv. helianthi]UNB66529.1 ABC transporter permease [Pseudomonas sy
MDMIVSVYLWFSLPDHWWGENGILTRLAEHIYYVSLSLLIACVIALPLGVLLANYRKGAHVAIAVFNIGRALPSLGIVILAIMLIGYDTSTVIIALVTMSIPPILSNTYVGIDQVDSSLKQAARSMGMRRGQVFIQLEWPLAFPLIFSGFRSALVQLIATATIAAYAGFGGLGRFLIDGLGRNDTPQIIGGAVMVSALAIVSEWVCSIIETLMVRKWRAGSIEPGAQ